MNKDGARAPSRVGTGHADVRPRPDGASNSDGRTLYVPHEVVLDTWRALRPTADAGAEGMVLWVTPASMYTSPVQVVTTVLVPRQRVSAGRYEIPPDAVRAMGRTLRESGLVNVAQVHTHPRDWVVHSAWDGAHAFSLREGALSIVWPYYGRVLTPMDAWGVHECRSHAWERLPLAEACSRVRVVPGVLDLRHALEWLPDDDEGESLDLLHAIDTEQRDEE